jgi:hypothetical protein
MPHVFLVRGRVELSATAEHRANELHRNCRLFWIDKLTGTPLAIKTVPVDKGET